VKVVKLVFFAGVREALGRSSEIVAVPSGINDLGALRGHFCARGAPWSLLAADQGWRFAVNRELAGSADAPIEDGDEVAVFPPVTGG
jgi:molybdopterin synthase sulfur carrier subunit